MSEDPVLRLLTACTGCRITMVPNTLETPPIKMRFRLLQALDPFMPKAWITLTEAQTLRERMTRILAYVRDDYTDDVLEDRIEALEWTAEIVFSPAEGSLDLVFMVAHQPPEKLHLAHTMATGFPQ